MVKLTAGNRPSRECPLARSSAHAAILVNEQRIVRCFFYRIGSFFDGLMISDSWKPLKTLFVFRNYMKNPRVMSQGCAPERSWKMQPQLHLVTLLRRIQMNFTGIKDFQIRVDIASFPVWIRPNQRQTSWLGPSVEVHYLKTLDWNNYEIAFTWLAYGWLVGWLGGWLIDWQIDSDYQSSVIMVIEIEIHIDWPEIHLRSLQALLHSAGSALSIFICGG